MIDDGLSASFVYRVVDGMNFMEVLYYWEKKALYWEEKIIDSLQMHIAARCRSES